MRSSGLASVAAAMAMAAVSLALMAQTAVNWPTRPVTLVVPLVAGGIADREMRPYLQKVQESTGQPFLLDFKPGGNGVIGNLFVAKANPGKLNWGTSGRGGVTHLVGEMGLPGYEYPNRLGMQAPAGTPAAIVNKASAKMARAVKSPDLATHLELNSITAIGSTPDEFMKVLIREVAHWKKLVAI